MPAVEADEESEGAGGTTDAVVVVADNAADVVAMRGRSTVGLLMEC